MTLSERVAIVAKDQIADDEHGIVAEGIVKENERLRPLIEALSLAIVVIEQEDRRCGHWHQGRTFLNELETALKEMEK